MARAEKRLAAIKLPKITRPGMYPDGGGLYLRVGPTGTKAWVLRFRANGKRHDMGLGPFPLVSLAEAREAVISCRKQRLQGQNPLELKRQQLAKQRLETAATMTFKAAAEAYIAAHEKGWKHAKHRAQWSATLASYAFPIFGDLPVNAVETPHIIRVLEPLWTQKTETASRLRGRIEHVLDWSRVRGHRTGENPARWRGHLDHLLPQRAKVQKVEHHAALPYRELPAFMKLLREQEGVAARALEFTILTAARTGEVLGARWEEISFEEKLWLVPGERMKAGQPHRVPLSQAAMAVLDAMKGISDDPCVFPRGRQRKPISDKAMRQLVKCLSGDDLTVHGFRSSFRDWTAEQTNFSSEVVEMALAHVLENKTEAAYRRGDLLEKRRELMTAWAAYCGGTAAA